MHVLEEKPLVSVILTSYNHQDYIDEAIQSVLRQSYENFELIIVDDCSTDDSWAKIKKYNDSRIIAIRNEKNMFIKGLKHVILSVAKGKYIAIHHSDDVWEAMKLAKQVDFMEENLAYGAVFSDVEIIDENSEHYELPEGHNYKSVFNQENRSKEEWLNYFFYRGNCLCHPSILIRQEMYEKYDLLAVDGLAQLPDFMMWVKLCLHQEIFILKDKLVKFRLRKEKQENTSSDRPEAHIRSQLEMYYLLQEYKKIPKTNIRKIFPESEQYIINDQMNIEFAIAKLALKVPCQPYWLFAIETLFQLINHRLTAGEIEGLYGYTDKAFMRDTAEYDIFGIKHLQKYLYTSLFLDYGDGFNEKDKISREVYVAQDGHFCAEYKVESGIDTVNNIRFDPTENELLKVQIEKVLINGQEGQIIAKNAARQENGYDVFLTIDPQYEIKCTGLKEASIVILGNIEKNLHLTLVEEREKAIANRYQMMGERDQVIRERDQVIRERDQVAGERDQVIGERDQVIGERNQVIGERDQVIGERDAIINSNGYKLLIKYYNARDSFQKFIGRLKR